MKPVVYPLDTTLVYDLTHHGLDDGRSSSAGLIFNNALSTYTIDAPGTHTPNIKLLSHRAFLLVPR